MSNWISVKDRLPEIEGFYLVYSKTVVETESGDVSPYYVDWFNIYEHEGDKDYWFSEFEDADYWMPLPEPPKP
jgi:hypothetical protein